MANQKEYELAFALSAQANGSFKSTFDSAKGQLSAMQKEINSLNKLQSDISSYTKMQQGSEATREKLARLQRQYDNIQQELAETGNSSSALKNKLEDKQAAIEKTTKALEEEEAKLRSLEKEMQEAGINTEELATESERLKKEADELKDKQEEAAQSAKSWGDKTAEAANTVATVLISAGIANEFKKINETIIQSIQESGRYADNISTMSDIYGISAENLQAYYYAAELVDVSVETMSKSMTKNIKSMYSAQQGSKAMSDAYERLGVKVIDTNGNLRDGEEVFFEVIDALGKMKSEEEADAVAMQLLGKSAMELNPLIKSGSSVLKSYAQEARNVGFILSDEMIKAGREADDMYHRNQSAMQALKNTIGAELAPEYTKLLGFVNETIASFTQWASENPEVVKGLSALLLVVGGLTTGLVAYAAIRKTIKLLDLDSIANSVRKVLASKANAAAYREEAAAAQELAAAEESASAATGGLIALAAIAALAIFNRGKELEKSVEFASSSARGSLERVSGLSDEANGIVGNKSDTSSGETSRLDSLRELQKKYREEADKAHEEYSKARKEQEEWLKDNPVEYLLRGVTSLMGETGAENGLVALNDTYNAGMQAFTEAWEKINELSDEIAQAEENVKELEKAEKDAADVQKIQDVIDKVKELGEAYEDVHAKALESLSGQFALWSKAPEMLTTSYQDAYSALASQEIYYRHYADDMQSLVERAGNIEGLDTFLEQADGTNADWVNYAAMLVGLSDDQIKELVELYNGKKDEMERAAQAEGDAKAIEFQKQMEEYEALMESTISELDLSDEAFQIASDNIQSFIDGAEGKVAAVESAYKRIGSAAMMAIRTPHLGSIDVGAMNGYTSPLSSKIDELRDSVADKAPSVISTSVTFSFAGEANGDTVSQLQGYGNEFAEKVASIITERTSDDKRRAYR